MQRLLARYSLAPEELRDPHAAETRLVRARMPPPFERRWRGTRQRRRRSTIRCVRRSRPRAIALVPGAVLDGARHDIAHRIERLERRVVAAAKRRESATMRDIEIARTSLFPLGKSQERVLNFIPMLARHGAPLSRKCGRARPSTRSTFSRVSPATHRMRGLAPPASERSGRAATLVATGILLSRIAGLVRQHFSRALSRLGDAADAFNAAFRIPNFLQNLFGEGVLSASFIPVYARLRAHGEDDAATTRRGRRGRAARACRRRCWS